jgi:hypothetical protein
MGRPWPKFGPKCHRKRAYKFWSTILASARTENVSPLSIPQMEVRSVTAPTTYVQLLYSDLILNVTYAAINTLIPTHLAAYSCCTHKCIFFIPTSHNISGRFCPHFQCTTCNMCSSIKWHIVKNTAYTKLLSKTPQSSEMLKNMLYPLTFIPNKLKIMFWLWWCPPWQQSHRLLNIYRCKPVKNSWWKHTIKITFHCSQWLIAEHNKHEICF